VTLSLNDVYELYVRDLTVGTCNGYVRRIFLGYGSFVYLVRVLFILSEARL
jgi:hypothetical protein